jgi:hypothetical protein
MPGIKEKPRAVLETFVRENLCDAVVRVLTQHGLQGLTMDRVAEAAGVSKGTLYIYPNVAYRSLSETRQGASDVVQHRLPTEGAY